MKYNGFEISVNVACENPSNDMLIELEEAIAKVVEEHGCVLLSGVGKYRRFKTTDD